MGEALFEHPIFGTDAPVDAERWLYHYTTLGAATAIALTRKLRLSTMARMNDPREYKVAQPVTMQSGGSPGLPQSIVKEALRLFVERRLNIRVASFTADAAHDAPGTGMRAEGRGYARPPLWAHYADRHRGCCLIFDRQALSAELSAAYGAESRIGVVEYVEGRAPSDWSGMLDLDMVACLGVENAIDQFITSNLDYVVFRKNEDWRAEREWRCCVLGQPSETLTQLSLPDGIVQGIVVGLDLSVFDLITIQHIAEQFRIVPNVGRMYVHQMNFLDVLPINTSTATWRFYDRSGLQELGYP